MFYRHFGRFLYKSTLVPTCKLFSTRPTSHLPPLAFAFDIDGVLLRGKTPILATRKAFEMVNGANPFGLKIPYILMTNGGGVSEHERCRSLSTKLGFELQVDQIMQAHTVLRHDWTREDHVLVLGGQRDDMRRVVEGFYSYGFQNVYIPYDVVRWNPAVWPLVYPPSDLNSFTKEVDFGQLEIQAAYVCHDPRNWGLDIQILLDLIRSGGVIGGPQANPEDKEQLLKLFFCNPDLIWRSDFEQPRLGQGAFREAFQGVYKAMHGSPYKGVVQMGKPTEITYSKGRKMLNDQMRLIYGETPETINVYMIGDNPESDIAGANAANWESVLVHTGVYAPGQPRSHNPTYEVYNVEKAVKWAIQREFDRMR